MIRCLDFPKCWHSGEANSVVDDPEQLLVRIVLHPLVGEIGCARVHPPARGLLCPPVTAMTYATILPVVDRSSFNTRVCVLRARRNSVLARPVNEEMLERVGYACLNCSGLVQCRKIKT
jgi:hypothetical protein